MNKSAFAAFCRGVIAFIALSLTVTRSFGQAPPPIEFLVPPFTINYNNIPIGFDNSVIINPTGTGNTGRQVFDPTGGVNDYTGSTSIQAGQLQAGTGIGPAAFSPNSDVIISGGGLLDINGNNETIASLASTDTTTSVTNSGNGSATLTVDDTNSSLAPRTYEFDGVITDAGAGNTLALVKNGTGTFIITGNNTYGGGTIINAGTVIAGANAFGTGNVTNNALLETTSVVNATAVNLHIAGNFTQSGDGSLVLQVLSSPAGASPNSGVAGVNYDTITVGGTASLGGALTLHFAPGTSPFQGQRFIALSAGAPLTTQFSSVTANVPQGFQVITTYNQTFGIAPVDSVIITLMKPLAPIIVTNPTYAGGAGTGNQYAIAQNIDSNVALLNGTAPQGNARDFINDIIPALNASVNEHSLGAALEQLSPQRIEILRNVAFDNYALDTQSLDDELARERYNPGGGINTTGFTMNNSALGATLSQVEGRLLAWNAPASHGFISDSGDTVLGGVKMTDSKDMKEVKQMAPVVAANPWNVFIDGGADLGDLEHNIDVSHSTYTTGRVRAGADYAVAPNARLGAFFGYSHTDADLDNEGSTATVDSYTPGVYFSYGGAGGFYANAVFTGTDNEYTTDRNIILPGLSRTAHGTTSGLEWGGDVDGGYDFRSGGWAFGPSAGLTYVNLGINSYSETGAAAANLDINNQSTESLRSRVGGAVRYQGRIGSWAVAPHLSAYWQHEFLDGTTILTSEFQGLPAGTFSVVTTGSDADTALLDFGIDAQVNETVGFFLDYASEAGGETFFGQQATGGVKLSF